MSAANNNTSSGAMTVVAVDATVSPSAVVTQVTTASTPSGDEAARAAVLKRYDGLMAVRAKAIKGKGAWYWAFLEPVRFSDPDTGLPKAVKLRCSLCDATFSASNPSRTASEHLKRGTCPNFTSPTAAAAGPATPSPTSAATPINSMPNSSSYPKPINFVPPSSSPPSYQVHNHQHHQHHHHNQEVHHNNRKRSSSSSQSHLPTSAACSSYQINPLPLVVDPTNAHFYSPSSSSSPAAAATPKMLALPPVPLILSGGKEDLSKLAMLEDSVKRLKSPESYHAVAALPKDRAEAAISYLADWVFQCCGAVSVSALDHPKFRSFLRQVGLPDQLLSPADLLGRRLDARHEEAWYQSKVRMREALFFQVSCDGCRLEPSPSSAGMVSLTLNLPNGTSVFWKAEFVHSKLSSDRAEDVLWEAATAASEDVVNRCAGIVSNRFRPALKGLEERYPWMVNLSCLLQGFRGLLKDLAREPELFGTVVGNCYKVARYFNRFGSKYRFNGHIREVISPSSKRVGEEDLHLLFSMLEDVAANAQFFRKMLHQDQPAASDPETTEVTQIILSKSFSEELNAVLALGKTVGELMTEVEEERPFVGQCLPLWENLKSRISQWSSEHKMDQVLVAKVVERRFNKSYHPAWSAAFVLDPLYLVKETSNKYLPPFKYLNAEQQKHVDDLISRLVPPEDAHIVISELMKWRSEGLDRTYALAVQMKVTDPITGKLKIANPQSSRLLWESQSELREFKLLGKVAARLIFLHATSSGYKCNSSFLRWIGQQRRHSVTEAQKIVFIAANAKLETGDFTSEEEKDVKFFARRDCVVPTDSDMQAAASM